MGQLIYSCRALLHTQPHTHALNPHSHTQTDTHTESHTQDPCESKTFLSAQVQARPPNRGVCTFIHGPSLEYGCFITISLVLVGPFFPLYYIVLPALLWNAKDCDLNGFWVLLIHRRHISHTKVAPKGQANSTKQRGSLKSQASLKYHGGDLLMEWFWLVCTDGPWSSVMGSGCWKTLMRCDKRCRQIGILWFTLLLSRVKEEERCFQSK